MLGLDREMCFQQKSRQDCRFFALLDVRLNEYIRDHWIKDFGFEEMVQLMHMVSYIAKWQ